MAAGSRFALIQQSYWQYLNPAFRGLDADVAQLEVAVAAGGYNSETFTQTGTLAVTTDATANRWYNDTGRTLTIDKVRATVRTAPTGAAALVDVNRNGTTIFTAQANRPTIAAAALTATSTPNVTTLANGQYLTVNVDQVGSTAPGSDLTVTVVLS